MRHRPHRSSSPRDPAPDGPPHGDGGARTAAAILEAAARLMPDYGYGRVTVRDLAREAGIGLGSVYTHFRGKEDIARALVEQAVRDLHAAMEGLLESALPAPECLRRLLVVRVTRRQEQAAAQRHPINELTPELAAALGPRRAEWADREARLLARALRRGHGEGSLAAPDPEGTAWAMLWATGGLAAEALQAARTEAPPPPPKPPPGKPGTGKAKAAGEASLAQRADRVAGLLVAAVLPRAPDGESPVV